MDTNNSSNPNVKNVIVISEETGTVSIAENGRIIRHLNSDSLRQRLRPLFVKDDPGIKVKDVWNTFGTWRKHKK